MPYPLLVCTTTCTGLDGRIGQNFLPSLLKWTGFYQDPLTRALSGTEFARADRNDLGNTFKVGGVAAAAAAAVQCAETDMDSCHLGCVGQGFRVVSVSGGTARAGAVPCAD